MIRSTCFGETIQRRHAKCVVDYYMRKGSESEALKQYPEAHIYYQYAEHYRKNSLTSYKNFSKGIKR